MAKGVANTAERGIINISNAKEEIEVHIVGKLDRNIYKCITEDIVTDDVIITEKQIQHIKDSYPNDYERFSEYFSEILQSPNYIVEANKPNTGVILKRIEENDDVFKTVLRIATSADNERCKNSILTFMKIDVKEWNRLLRNKKILYKNE